MSNWQFLQRFCNDESGGSAAEYALILAVVGPGIGAAALVLGANVKGSGDSFEADLAATNATSTTLASAGSQGSAGTGSTGSGTTDTGTAITDTGTGGSTTPGKSGTKTCNGKAAQCN